MVGDLRNAAILFNEAIKLDPGYAESYDNLGFVCYKKGDYRKAKEYYEKALQLDPSRERTRANLNVINSLIPQD